MSVFRWIAPLLCCCCYFSAVIAYPQEFKFETGEEYLPFLQAGVEGVASKFEQGDLAATVELRGMLKTDIHLIWKGERAMWRVEEQAISDSSDPKNASRNSSPTRVERVHTGRETIVHYPAQAKVTIYPHNARGAEPPKYANVIPSHFWKSAHPELPTLARAISPEVIAATCDSASIKRVGAEIVVTKRIKGGFDSTLKFELDDSARLLSIDSTGAPAETLRMKARLGWKALSDGSNYLEESKFWFASGNEPYRAEPSYSYRCKKISRDVPSALAFDLSALELPTGTKFEHYNMAGNLAKITYPDGEAAHKELLLRMAALQNRKKGISASE